MDQLRKSRYKTKMRYVLDSLSLAEGLLTDPDEVQEKALYYCLLTSIESVMDLIAMLIKDRGDIAKGNQYNIEYLEEKEFLTPKLANHLQRCNRLRNVLVHQYNGIDKEIVIESFVDVRQSLTETIGILEEYLDAH